MNRMISFPFKRFILIVGIIHILGALCCISNVEAFQINHVQYLKAEISSTEMSVDVALKTPVDPDKSLLTCSVKVKTLGDHESADYIAAYFIDRYTVRLLRQSNGSDLEVSLSVAEFKDGVKVSRGVTLFSKNVYQKRIAVPICSTNPPLSFYHP